MSPSLLWRRLSALPTSVTLTAVAAVGATAVAVLAGSALGPAALILVIPAGAFAVAAREKLELRYKGLAHLAHVDPLTGLGNKRQLRQRMDYEIARHRRHQRKLAVLYMDLDGFKQVNDRFGHGAGDELLREIARQLQRAVREEDTLVRAGGDEFVILAPETDYRDAECLADRLSMAVRRASGGLDGVSASIGYAIFPDEGATPELLIASADAAEMEAKRRTYENARPNLRVA
jgi:diguanylate cyclase (GGDEF)-like protein